MNAAGQNSELNHRQSLNANFGDLYVGVRDKEKRILTDGELMFLPDIEPSHIHFKEWQIRKRSSERLMAYLRKKNKQLKILEIGCGNGWLSAKMSSISNTMVTGLDINLDEINQARRVFQKDNLSFICGDFDQEMLDNEKFDIILFAASIQYFRSLKSVLKNAFILLAEQGEIHILDTPFYRPREIHDAVRRTENYYTMMGYPEMAAYYFHHSVNDILQLNCRILLNPRSLINRVWKKEPFYWISINH